MLYADVAELADALDSKSSGKPCGFEWYDKKILYADVAELADALDSKSSGKPLEK